MPRLGNWEPATVIEESEDMEIKVEDLPEEPGRILVEMQTERITQAHKSPVPKKKFMDYLKENVNTEDLLDEIMDQRISIHLHDIITSLDSLMKLMFKGIPKEIDEKVPVVKVGNMLLQKDHRMYAAVTLKVHIKIGNITVNAMLDSGMKVNVMMRALVDKARLTIQMNLVLALKTVSGEMRRFDGACEDINVSIGGITNIQTIM